MTLTIRIVIVVFIFHFHIHLDEMFTLLKGAYGEIVKRDEYFVAILGLDSAGKSVYLERVRRLLDKTCRKRDITKITSTVGLNHVVIQLKEFILNFWDLGGQAELRSLWNSYLDECDAIIFVIDSNDMARDDEIIAGLEQIMSVMHVHAIPFLILLNKCDSDGERPHGINGTSIYIDPITINCNQKAHSSINSAEHTKNPPKEINKMVVDEIPSSSDWQSFELDPYNEWETQSESDSSSFSNIQPALITERIRSEFDDRFGSFHRGDFAIISISARQNINVKKSVNWLLNSITSYKKELSKS